MLKFAKSIAYNTKLRQCTYRVINCIGKNKFKITNVIDIISICSDFFEFWDTVPVWWYENFCNYGMQFPLGIDLLPMKQINKSKYIRQYVHQFYSRIKATKVNTYAATQSMISCIIFHTFKNVRSVTTSKAIIPISFYDISCM